MSERIAVNLPVTYIGAEQTYQTNSERFFEHFNDLRSTRRIDSTKGEIVTFYSFKGGVGRSRTLANVAYQLAQSGKKVLCIDFDLEAPDLERYFLQSSESREKYREKLGMIDILFDYRDYFHLTSSFRKLLNWKELVTSISLGNKKEVTVDLLGPGQRTRDYGEKVINFDWRAFYEEWKGADFIEYLREQFRQNYDFILIDSRTGTSDIGGVCTIQLPTILVLLFTTSPASLEGLEGLLDSIQTQQREFNFGFVTTIIPVPSRVDRTIVSGDYEAWFGKLTSSKLGLLVNRIDHRENIATIFQEILIEYDPWYAYHNDLESVRESIDDPGSNAYRYRNLIRMIQLASPQYHILTGLDNVNKDLLNTFLVDPSKGKSHIYSFLPEKFGEISISLELEHKDNLTASQKVNS